jgi:uncharacterized protein YbaR (Trm112 family)
MFINLNGLQCVRCLSQRLEQQADALYCARCGACYPILFDVPIFFSDVLIQERERPSERFAEEIASLYPTLPQTSETIETLRAIFSRTYRFGDFLIDAEANQYLNRIQSANSLPEVAVLAESAAPRRAAPPRPTHSRALSARIARQLMRVNRYLLRQLAGQTSQMEDIQASETAAPASRPYRYRWVREYIPRRMQAGKLVTSNVRLENLDERPLSSLGPQPLMIAYQWLRPDGALAVHDGLRTAFLVDVQPGRQLTVPVMITAPATPGSYLLRLALVHKGVAWLLDGAMLIPIHVDPTPPPTRTTQWQITNIVASGYLDDHKRGIELLCRRIERLAGRSPKILEVGGNANPSSQYLRGQRFNVDVDIFGLQVGALAHRAQAETLHFFCADANNPPFVDETFDAAHMFASLHHFPDPTTMLRALSSKLKPGGLLAALCEPIGHPFAGSASQVFIDELLKGVNEQSFSLEEYAELFLRAGLDEDEVFVDVGSLKAFLRKPAQI